MNQQNPLGSTGPKSDAGKFESSKNALTHGLSASSIDRFPESLREDYQQFLASYYEEWQPATTNEAAFLERHAFAQFQLLRAQSLLATAFDALAASPLDAAAEKHYAKISRHLRALERSARESLKELRLLIADRMLNMDADEHLSAQLQLPLTLPAVFPHHLLTDPKSIRQPLDRQALRFAYQQFEPVPETKNLPREQSM